MNFKSSIILACLAATTDAVFYGNNTNSAVGVFPKDSNNNYIVVYKSNATTNSMGSARTWSANSFGAKVKKTNLGRNLGMKIDVLDLSDSPQGAEQAAALLAQHPDVAYVEKDQIGTPAVITQDNPPWGLDRIDQPKMPLNNQFRYADQAGVGIKVYVLDTGVKIDNPEFEGRASWGPDFTGEGNADVYGHGTHCAGTVGSKTYGVAKKTQIISVKVMSRKVGGGYISDFILGTDWAVSDCGKGKCVLSMSIQNGYSLAFNDAIENAFYKGLVPVVAAGNYDVDGCTFSPSSATPAIAVGASDINDHRAGFSNYGRCIDIHAPGVGVESVNACDGGTLDCVTVYSGTSMATPHVAGMVALIWSRETNLTTPAQVISRVYELSSKGVLTGLPPYTPNRLSHAGI